MISVMTQAATLHRSPRLARFAVVTPGRALRSCVAGLCLALELAGCSSVRGSAIRTGGVVLPAYVGPVAIYSLGQPPAGAVDLGVVEVHATQQEATVDTLMPQFAGKVAQIGGNVAVLDGIRARFELVGRMQVETFYYACGLGATCAGTRAYSANDELMVVSVFGRAFSTQVVAPSASPLLPNPSDELLEDSDEPPGADSSRTPTGVVP